MDFNILFLLLCTVYFLDPPASVQSNAISENDEDMWIDDEIDTDEVNSGCVFCTRQFRWKNGANQRLTQATLESKKNHIFEILRAFNQD